MDPWPQRTTFCPSTPKVAGGKNEQLYLPFPSAEMRRCALYTLTRKTAPLGSHPASRDVPSLSLHSTDSEKTSPVPPCTSHPRPGLPPTANRAHSGLHGSLALSSQSSHVPSPLPPRASCTCTSTSLTFPPRDIRMPDSLLVTLPQEGILAPSPPRRTSDSHL